MDNTKLTLERNNKYNVTNSTIIEDKNYLPINELVEIKGSKPTGREDYITLNNVGQVIEGKLTISGYIIEIKNGNITNVKKDKTIKVKEMSINITEQTMEKNSTFKIIPSFEPIDASNQEVTYESSNTNVVTVDELGNVKAINSRTAKITVMSKENSNIKAECNITVIVSATSLTISPKEKQIRVGETVQLSGTIEPGDVTSNALTWSTSNPNIATINSNGLVTGVREGEVTITASTVNGISDTSKVKITDPIIQAATASNKTIAGNIPQGNFAKGDEYIVNVDGTHKYHFYILNVEGNKVSLIMSKNICSDGTLATTTNTCYIAWYSSSASNSTGPVTIMNYLHQATKNWNNIENIQMNYTDEGNTGSYGYGTIKTSGSKTTITKKDGTTTSTYTNLKARMPKTSEIYGARCRSEYGSCPAWMMNGLSSYTSKYPTGTKEDINGISGYWSLSSSVALSSSAVYVNYRGTDLNTSTNLMSASSDYWSGLRPVIEVSKSDLS